MLELEDVHACIGSFEVLNGIDLQVREGELVALLGANGAGKSTLMQVIVGLIKPTRGTITYEGEDIAGVKTEKLVRKGIALCPENRHLFPRLSVRRNLSLGAYTGSREARLAEEGYAFVFELFPILRERCEQMAGTLSGGEQQMLAIGRALMSKPRLLLLDEPSLGLAPKMVEAISDRIVEINSTGTTVLLSEQNASIALSISRRGYVMESGTIVLEGESHRLADDPRVRKAYLGL